MRWSELRGAAAMLWREYQLSSRAPALRAVAAFGALFVLWRTSSPGTTAALAAYQTWQVAGLGLGVVGILLAGAFAGRDRRQAAWELVLVKPAGSAGGLPALRFLAVWLSLLTVAAIMLGAAGVGQVVRGGTPWRMAAYLGAFLRSVVPLGLASALGFSLASLFTAPLASAVAALYWVAVPLGRSYLPLALDLTLSQHWPLSALLAAALLALTISLHARPLRGRQRAGARVGLAAGLLFAGAALAALLIASRGDDASLKPDPTLSAIASQIARREERAPGFWLPDPEGHLVALTDFASRPAVLAFWGPAAPESARLLALLKDLAGEFRSQRLACLAVCLDRDAGAVHLFAGEAGGEVVLLWDRGRHFGTGLEWCDSPLAVSYDIGEVPTVCLLDEERHLVEQMSGEGVSRLREAVSQLLVER